MTDSRRHYTAEQKVATRTTLGLAGAPRFPGVYSGEVSAVVVPWGKEAVDVIQGKLEG